MPCNGSITTKELPLVSSRPVKIVAISDTGIYVGLFDPSDSELITYVAENRGALTIVNTFDTKHDLVDFLPGVIATWLCGNNNFLTLTAATIPLYNFETFGDVVTANDVHQELSQALRGLTITLPESILDISPAFQTFVVNLQCN